MKKPQTIFVCSMADLFGEWVPNLWIELIFAEIQKAKQHTYIFLTKNPSRYLKIPGTYFSKNIWFGTTVTGIGDIDRVYELQKLPLGNKFISFEPLLGEIKNLDLTGIKQVIIGAQTNPLLLPSAMATANVYFAAKRDGAKVFYKDSIVDCHPKEYTYDRDLCWQVQK
jgi:protein gp37